MAGPFFSTQLTSVNAQTVLQPGQGGGDGFIIPWNYTTAGGGGPAVGEIVYLGNIPEGFYLAGIHIDIDAMGTSTTVDIGDDDDPDRYVAGASVNSPTFGFLSIVLATGYLFRNDKPRQLRATAQGATWGASKKFFGFALGFKDA
ncbi:MAG TPA: hypothetical protein VGH16_16340 [Candidatus Binatia bacterium]|jgi:hypothetical protein